MKRAVLTVAGLLMVLAVGGSALLWWPSGSADGSAGGGCGR